jgi:hypothetical protein
MKHRNEIWRTILNGHRSALERLTQQLLQTENVDGAAVQRALVKMEKV